MRVIVEALVAAANLAALRRDVTEDTAEYVATGRLIEKLDAAMCRVIELKEGRP